MTPPTSSKRLILLSLAATLLLAVLAIAGLALSGQNHPQAWLVPTMAVIALVDVGLVAGTNAAFTRQSSVSPAAITQIESDGAQLEERVRRRTAELAALSSHLQYISEKEKAALARELHDELGGLLIAVKMDATWLHKRWPNPSPEIQARWVRVLKVLDDGVDFKRRVVENLRPTLLDNMGLLPAVRWIVEETCGRAGLRYTEVYPELEPQLSEDAGIMLFRLVQESLVNVVKHAHATHVRVQIDLDDLQLEVIIEDNGSGIDPERLDDSHSHGLAIMRHLVRSCGGTLQLETASHGGTRVHAKFPLDSILRAPASSGKTTAGTLGSPPAVARA